MPDTIFITGMPEEVTEEQIEEHFGAIGIIKTDKKTRKKKIWIYKVRSESRAETESPDRVTTLRRMIGFPPMAGGPCVSFVSLLCRTRNPEKEKAKPQSPMTIHRPPLRQSRGSTTKSSWDKQSRFKLLRGNQPGCRRRKAAEEAAEDAVVEEVDSAEVMTEEEVATETGPVTPVVSLSSWISHLPRAELG